MRYTHYLDTVAMAVDEIIVPHFLDLLVLVRILLTSKQLRNKINARPCIAQHIRTALGIPAARMRHPIKVLTFFRIRSGASDLPRSLTTEYGFAIAECCAICFQHQYRTSRVEKYHLSKDKEWAEGDFLFTNGLERCTKCPQLVLRSACNHPSHIYVDRRIHNQRVCRACFVS